MIQIEDKQFEIFISENEISKETKFLGAQISSDYKNKEVVFVAMLNGAFMFAADLLKEISIPCVISFVKFSSYHGTESTGKVNELIGLNQDLKGKHIIILEDIVDSGTTMDHLMPTVLKENPASIKICTLLFKPDAFRGHFKPDYIGFSISNAFVVGYGLDYDGLGRNLNAIYQLKKED